MNETPRQIKILIVDDDQDIQEYLADLLRNQGYAILVANSVDEAWAQFRFRRPDLVLTDLSMPGKDGTELIFKIRENSPACPVIAMSGGYKQAQKNLEMAGVLGANVILNKPFRGEQLLREIGALLPA